MNLTPVLSGIRDSYTALVSSPPTRPRTYYPPPVPPKKSSPTNVRCACEDEPAELSGPLTATVAGCSQGTLSLSPTGTGIYSGSGILENGRSLSIRLQLYESPAGWLCEITSSGISASTSGVSESDPFFAQFRYQVAGIGSPCGNTTPSSPSEDFVVTVVTPTKN